MSAGQSTEAGWYWLSIDDEWTVVEVWEHPDDGITVAFPEPFLDLTGHGATRVFRIDHLQHIRPADGHGYRDESAGPPEFEWGPRIPSPDEREGA